jgi:large repetitive protein
VNSYLGASGSVAFLDVTTNKPLGAAVIDASNNTASITTDKVSLGDFITATYSGNNNVAAGSTGQIYNPAPTTLSVYNYGYYFYLSVRGSVNATPTGTIDIYDETAHQDLGSIGYYGYGYFNPPSSAIGHVITAIYSGNAYFGASSAILAFNSSLGPTTITLTPTLSPDGENVTLTATVAYLYSSYSIPQGAVQFFDQSTGKPLSGNVPLDDGTASVTASIARGDMVTVSYLGDGIFAPGGSSVIVNFSSSTLALSSQVDSDGQSVAFVATVGGANYPSTGTVDFIDVTTGQDLGSAPVENGRAFLAPSEQPTLGDRITATASVSGLFPSSASLVYTLADTSTTLNSMPSPDGSGVTFTAYVTGRGGSVDFVDSTTGVDLTPGGVPLLGSSTSWTGAPEAGDVITAIYSGNGYYSGSQASQTFFPVSTSTSIESSLSSDGQSISFTANVSTPIGGFLTGTVDFVDLTTGTDLTPSGVLLSNGAATTDSLTTVSLAGHRIVANFLGSTAYASSSASQVIGSDALTTPNDIMASPDSVGSTLLEAAGATYVGERDAVKLAFNDTGTVLAQQDLPTVSVDVSGMLPPTAVLPQGASPYFTITQAFQLGDQNGLPGLTVPNTLPPGAPEFGKTFDVTAVAVNATLKTPSQTDFYAFKGKDGQLMTFQVISNANTQNPNPILPELLVVGPNGQVVGYNVREFESADSTLLDLYLPQDGTYYVGVDSLLGLTVGNYQLLMYSFAATNTDPSSGDTLVGGGGQDTLVGSSGDDQITFPSGASGYATLLGGSGADTLLNLKNYTSEHLTLLGNFSPIPQNTPTALTPTLTVSATDGLYNGKGHPATVTLSGAVAGVDNVASVSLEGVPVVLDYQQVDANGTVLQDLGQRTPVSVGSYVVTVSFAGSLNYSAVTASASFSIGQVTPTVAVSDAGVVSSGTAFPATAKVTGVGGVAGTGLEGVGLTLTYYAGDSATGTPLPDAPSTPGTYTVVASFAGSADYSAASAQTSFTISQSTGQTTPTVTVSDAGGTYKAAAFTASATVNGGSSLEGVGLTLEPVIDLCAAVSAF